MRKIYILICAIIFSLAVAALSAPLVQADQHILWVAPNIIPGVDDSGPSAYPVFIADAAGNVLMFNSQWVGDTYSIVFSRWVRNIGWTNPVDLLMSPNGDARVSGGLVDDMGMVHLAFWGGDDTSANLYYARAPLASVENATAWSSPQLIGRSAFAPDTAALVGDGERYMLLLYGGNLIGNGFYAVQSEDAGLTWSNPTPIYLTGDPTVKPVELQMIIDREGQVHAVWSVVGESGDSQAIYYAQLNTDHTAWEEPKILAEAIDYEAATPAILKSSTGELFVIYHNDRPTMRWMRRSLDNGQTWTNAVRLFEHRGSNGAATLVQDHDGTIHLFFGNRIGQPATHGIWESLWLGTHWSVPEAIMSGPQVLIGSQGEEGFDPSFAQALVTNENLIFLAWRHDPLAGPQNIWFTYKQFGNPIAPTPSSPALETSLIAEATSEPSNLPTVTPVENQELFLDSPGSTSATASNLPLWLSIIPVVVFIGLMYAIRTIRK